MKHPFENIYFVISGMCCALLSSSCAYLLVVWLMVCIIILGFLPVKRIDLLKYIGIPFSFILLSAISIIFDFNYTGLNAHPHTISIWGLKVYFSSESIHLSALMASKSLCLLTFLYYLILTTPIHHLFAWMNKYKLTKTFGEMMLLTYRQINMIKDAAADISCAQKSRLGYANRRQTRHDLIQLFSRTFVLSLQKTDTQFRAMEARCYDGEIQFLSEEHQWNRGRLLLITLGLSLQIIGLVLVHQLKIV